MNQSQISLHEQLIYTARLANQHGFYDAADWILEVLIKKNNEDPNDYNERFSHNLQEG